MPGVSIGVAKSIFPMDRLITPAALRPVFIPRISLGEFSDWESQVPFPETTLRQHAHSHILLAVPSGTVLESIPTVKNFLVPYQQSRLWFLKGKHGFSRKPEACGWALLPFSSEIKYASLAPAYVLLVLAVVLRRLGRGNEWQGGESTDVATDSRGSDRPIYVLSGPDGVRITTRVRPAN
jgi:hypothetical protein